MAIGADDAPPNTPSMTTNASVALLKTPPCTRAGPLSDQLARSHHAPAGGASAAIPSARQKRQKPEKWHRPRMWRSAPQERHRRRRLARPTRRRRRRRPPHVPQLSLLPAGRRGDISCKRQQQRAHPRGAQTSRQFWFMGAGWQRGSRRRRHTAQHAVESDKCGGIAADSPPPHSSKPADAPLGAGAAPRAGASSISCRPQCLPEMTASWRVCSGRQRFRRRRRRAAINAVRRGQLAGGADDDHPTHKGSSQNLPSPAPAKNDGVLTSVRRPATPPSARRVRHP